MCVAAKTRFAIILKESNGENYAMCAERYTIKIIVLYEMMP